MSQLKEALKRKIEKEKQWSTLTPEGKEELEQTLIKMAKEGRQKVVQRGEFFRRK